MRGAGVLGVAVRTDPGLDRARTAGTALVSLAGAIVAVLALSQITGAGGQRTLTGVVVCALTAVNGSLSLLGAPPGRLPARAALVWATAAGSVTLGLLVASAGTPVHLVATVVASFVAAWLRRFGQAAALAGVLGWLLFLVAGVLAAPPSLALGLSGDLALTVAWMVLTVPAFRPSPARVLRLSLRSVLVGAAAVVARGDRALAAGGSGRAVARLVRVRTQVARAALSADAQFAGGDAGASGERARLLDLHLAVDELARATAALARTGTPPVVVARARAVLGALDHEGAAAAVRHLREAGGAPEVARVTGVLASAALELAPFLDGRRAVLDPDVPVPPVRPWAALPGSAAVVAQDAHPAGVGDAGAGPGRLVRAASSLHPSTRQAVQVAVAVGVTVALVFTLSPRYYFWAVIAAFVVYGGTTTRGETLVKAFQRLVGTVAGLVVGFLVTDTLGAGLAVVVTVALLAFPAMLYWRQASYTLSVLAVSIALPVLYDALHRPLAPTLELRVAETAIGVVVATVVAQLVLPTRTGDVVHAAERRVDDALAALLDAVVVALGPDGRAGGLDARARTADSRLHELTTAVQPQVHPLVIGAVSSAARARLHQRSRAVAAARGLAGGVRARRPGHGVEDLARVCLELAATVRTGSAPSPALERSSAAGTLGAGTADEAATAGLWVDVRHLAASYTLLAETGEGGTEGRGTPQTPSSFTPA